MGRTVITLNSATYSEATEQYRPRQLQFSHLSIEVGHFYMKDLLKGEDRIRFQFKRVAPWVAAATTAAAVELGDVKPRVSTCFLIDDYFCNDTNPASIIDMVNRIATECGITIDYLAREAGCCVVDNVSLAELAVAMLLPEPPVGTNGSRPPLRESGWLCNGEHFPDAESEQAMLVQPWRPPVQFGKRNHSIFVDVELWKDTTERVGNKLVSRRTWSCPLLASIWHLLRLGMLRHYGEPVAQPQQWPTGAAWPQRWGDLPAVTQLNPRAAPFAAFRSTSILPHSYLEIEHAVAIILDHFDIDEAVVNQVIERGCRESLVIPREITGRISHIFIEDSEGAKNNGMPNANLGRGPDLPAK
jgi:hypothetical protein